MGEKEKCRKGNVQYFCMYTAGFLAAALLLLLIFAKEHASFTKMVDGVAQHYAVLMWIRNTLRQFLHGNFALPMVDFSVGQGFDVIGTLNYYGVGDPVNLLTVFFADNHLDQMYMFLILFRMYLSGLTFSYYCSTAGIQRKASVLCGSWLYVFCSFALIGGMKHPLFLNGMLYLPLLLAGTEKVLQKKSIRFLSVSVALAFMSNYYFMYMNTILCGIYLCVRLFGHYREYGIRKILLLILKMAAAWIWGICLGAVIILPSVYAFLHNARVDTAVEEAQNFYSIAHYRKMILGFFQTLPMTNGWTVHGTAIGGLAGVLMLFTSKKRSRENCQLKIGFVVLLVLLCIPFGGKMMNGFAYVTNRWSYGMAFLCALMAAQEVADLKEQNTKIFLILGAAAGILAAALSASNGKAMRYAIAALAVTVLAFALGAILERKQRKRLAGCLVSFVVFAGVCCNLITFFTPVGYSYAARFTKRGVSESVLLNRAVKNVQNAKLAEDGFYRVELPSSLYNCSLAANINTTEFYYSVIPKSMKDLYVSLGMAKYERPNVMEGLENRQILKNMLCVRYQADKKGITVNKDALPVGYTYDKIMSREDYDRLTPLECQAALLEYAVLDDDAEKILEKQGKTFERGKSPSDGAVIGGNLKITGEDRASWKNGTLKGKKQGRMKLKFQTEEKSETYLVLKDLSSRLKVRKKHMLSVQSKKARQEIPMCAVSNEKKMKRDVIAVNLGIRQAGTCSLHFHKSHTYKLKEMEIYGISESFIKEQTKKRRKESMTDIKQSTNCIKGRISVSEDKILQLAVPYSRGWHIFVDGKKEKSFASSVAYTGIFLEKGEHTVEMHYISPWIIPGTVLSVAAWIWMALSFAVKKRRISVDKRIK
ncbi:YfhO family protein [Lachnospiraceae bacterium CLA-AA-H246]|uniref:YfhO family protein n=1 Tax=Hominisplanchenecus faecis TaxID=2885351 RepID=A0ABS8EWR5_9FIRM|nr:YfhO family protein [Hominisplanchenecus faecis]MCC2149636.1 YfhO family protein [Hominisplanchenecus faecis]